MKSPHWFLFSVGLISLGIFVVVGIADAFLGISWVWVIGGFVALALVVGMILPRTQLVSRSMSLHQRPEMIWQTLLEYGGFPASLALRTTVERLPDREDRPTWKFIHSNGLQQTLEASEVIPLRRIVIPSQYNNRPCGWSAWDIQEHDGGSRVTMTVCSEISNPLHRLVGYIPPFTSGRMGVWMVEANLKALAAHLGELDTAVVEGPGHDQGPEKG
jgi:hypothetical protein